MSDPALPLQKAVRAALVGSATLATAMGGTVNVYDRVKPDAVFPYLNITDAQTIDDGNSCDEHATEAFVDVHIWSRVVGAGEAKEIGSVVRSLLATILTVEGWRCVVGNFENARWFRDSDGLSVHGVMTFRYLLDPE